MSILSLKEIKDLQYKPNPIIFYFILSTIISLIILISIFGKKIDNFTTLEYHYIDYLMLILLSFFITIILQFIRLDLIICGLPYLMLKDKLKKYKIVKLRDSLNHLYLTNKRNILVSKILFSISLFLIIPLICMVGIINYIIFFIVAIAIIIMFIGCYNYKSFYVGVKLIFFMNLFYQDNKMLKGFKEFIDYIKYNQWFEAKSTFLSFIRKELKEIYQPCSQKLKYYRIMEEFREFCVNLSDIYKTKDVNEKIELFFISLNRVLGYKSSELYKEDFITPLLDTLKYFAELKNKISRWDNWIKYFAFNDENFELLIDEQIIQEMNELIRNLDINAFRSILKANYPTKDEKEHIYRLYEKFVKSIQELHAAYLSIFLGILNSQDYKDFLGQIKKFTISLEKLFKKKINKKESQKIFDCYKNILINLYEVKKKDTLEENLKKLKAYEEYLDELEIYIDFSKKFQVQIYLDFSIINELYYPLITLELRIMRLFEFKIQKVYPNMNLDKIKSDITIYLKKIAEKKNLIINNDSEKTNLKLLK